jgi:hypothetical protein
MNIVLASVNQPPLSGAEIDFLRQRTGVQGWTWNRFIEMILLI